MGFRIATNVASLTAQKALRKVTNEEVSISAKLSSGSRITKSADDAAGLAISEKLKSGIRSTQQANRNANDGISMIQVAEGALGEQSNMLVRLRELAIQSASDTVGDTERSYSDLEYQQLKTEIGRISSSTEFNGTKLLSGTGDKLDFQIGTGNDDVNDRISYDTSKMDSGLSALGIDGEGVSSKEDAQNSLASVDSAIDNISGQRAVLGSMQNRLQVTSSNLETSAENMTAANSRIRDVDYAAVAADNAKNSILKQAGTSVLAQTQSSPQSALRLIG